MPQLIDTSANINLGGDIFLASFLPPQTDIFKVPAKIVGSRKLEKNMLFSVLKYFSQPVCEELWYLPAAEQGSEFQEGGVFCAYPAFFFFFDLPVEISLAFLNLQASKKPQKLKKQDTFGRDVTAFKS